MGVVINPRRAERPIHEVENAAQFEAAVRDAETVDGKSKRLDVVICVKSHPDAVWRDHAVYWTGTRDQGVRVPTKDELLQVCRDAHERFAKYTVRFTT